MKDNYGARCQIARAAPGLLQYSAAPTHFRSFASLVFLRRFRGYCCQSLAQGALAKQVAAFRLGGRSFWDFCDLYYIAERASP